MEGEGERGERERERERERGKKVKACSRLDKVLQMIINALNDDMDIIS